MDKTEIKHSKAAVTGFILSLVTLLLMLPVFCNYLFFEGYYVYLLMVLVAGAFLSTLTGLVFLIIGLVNTFKKNMKGKVIAVIGSFIICAEVAVFSLAILLFFAFEAYA